MRKRIHKARTARASLGALALLLWLAIAPGALAAGPPARTPLPALDIAGLNHACGTAVDSQGDVYVSSAAESKIYVFDSEHHLLGQQIATIPNANEPCGLAVDTGGNLYVSESATGDVVKYHPAAYPFSGSPNYGLPVTIDSSGEAAGIAVDPANDRLLVARGAEVVAYANETQRLDLGTASGTYQLTFKNATTGPIPADANHAVVQAALEGLPTIGAGNVSVADEGESVSGNSVTHRVMFVGALAATNVESLECIEGLCTVVTRSNGVGGQIRQDPLADYSGVAAYTYQSANSKFSTEYISYVFAIDSATEEVKIFSQKISGEAVEPLSLLRAIDGSDQDAFKKDKTPDNGIGLGVAGASLAADWANGHFLVYDAEHQVVNEFEADGQYVTQTSNPGFVDGEPTGLATLPNRDEVQGLATACTGGSFTLDFEGETTEDLPCKVTVAQLQASLEALAPIGTGNVAVSGEAGFSGGNFAISFVEDLGDRDVDQLTADGSGLTNNVLPLAAADVTTDAQGSGPGRLYVTAGGGVGARLLAFGPLVAPSREPLPKGASLTLQRARTVAVDFYGNRYVGTEAKIGIYPPGSETPLLTIDDPAEAADLAVDSECNVYVLDKNIKLGVNEQTVRYFAPSSCPPTPATTYAAQEPIVGPGDFKVAKGVTSIAVDPATDDIYVTQEDDTIKLDSAADGSNILDKDWGPPLPGKIDIDVCGATGAVYFADDNGRAILVVSPDGTKILNRITGRGAPRGRFYPRTGFAVDQANCHVITFVNSRGTAEEFEASGTFVTEFGSFTKGAISVPYRVAIDGSCALQDPPLSPVACEAFDPAYGSAYVAFDDPENKAHPFDLAAFGPLSYGLPPSAETGLATDVSPGEATLNGSVDPRGFALEDCHFEYLEEAAYEKNLGEAKAAFDGAAKAACVPGVAEIGKGSEATPVQAHIDGLNPEERYRYRLVAVNKYGSSEGKNGVLGPPLATTGVASPVSYAEATLRATVDPSGFPTKYHFEYGTTEAYGGVTSTVVLPAAAGMTDITVPIFGLAEGATYHFRVVAENLIGAANGQDEAFTTLERREAQSCPNDEFRTGASASLPDCRAYELVTPADTRGLTPNAADTRTHQFDVWPVAPNGIGAGKRVSFFVNGTVPGFDGNGFQDGYRAVRAEGAHPQDGWGSELFSPTYSDAAISFEHSSNQEGVSFDQEYSIWSVPGVAGTLGEKPGVYLRTPDGFEVLGQGSLGADPDANSHYVSAGGAHVIFGSKAHLEPATPLSAANTEAIYERAAGDSNSVVVSLKPGDTPFDSGEDAIYLGSTENGSAIVFEVDGALYLRREKQTVEVAAAPNTFAGISADGKRVFFVDANIVEPTPAPAGLRVFDAETLATTAIADSSRFVNVSADGSHVYFTSTAVVDDGLEGVAGENNLYDWDGATEAIRFVSLLDPEDLSASGFLHDIDNLIRWPGVMSGGGRGRAPARSTPDGSVLVFQSHAQLTPYDNTEATAAACGNPKTAGERCFEIYLYDSTAAPGEQVVCVSCDPTGAHPNAPAVLQELRTGISGSHSLLIPNVTDDGKRVFFQSNHALLPEDANQVSDVYEWMAHEASGCTRAAGCLALISSGQGDEDNLLYGMTPDGNDVFFTTLEKLHGADIAGSASIYDARVEGGIPNPATPAPCRGDACQGRGSAPTVLPVPASGSEPEGESPPARRCPKGKHKQRRKGKVRCVKGNAKKQSHGSKRHQANPNRRASQ